MNASYSSGGATFEDPDSSLSYSLQPSWSLSLLYHEALQGGEQDSTGSSVPSTDASIRESVSEDFSLEYLSAAAGLSVEEFTNKIAEGAKYALETVADYEHFSSALADPSGRDLFPQLAPFSEIANLVDPWLPPGVGINPADVMPAPSLLSDGASLDKMFNLLGTHLQPEDQCLDYPRLPDLQYPATPPRLDTPLDPSQNRVPTASPQAREDGDQLSEYEPPASFSPSSSEYSPSLGSGRQYYTRGSRVKKRKIAQCDTILAPVQGPPVGSLPLLPVDLGSPVFDAHRGIHLEDLKARAERYRLRNQGREYDKRWLLSFAGKLSNKGELLEEFRCYIAGCKQVNKRRDHILIHVGAHLDQRPFRCVHCDARFLRKNECKRHELSHTGIRPFTCNICQDPAPTFVRQDLLRRHMKRSHQVDVEKENKRSASRPRKRVRKF
ncbi:hypothetical protein EST38_g4693 [Candolleomyces aberdarensis]|uniref:C2H2-type domain-containing protein n=1 Tax=Candolleomyces aberdarensis TaxID=2316362 RepID=A0A4Q2DME0_9AGAR|nr:hypothetical protein EST38_g4693 [Candolleomyces aberdarensis]